jgi:tetratricopeptide (TPR) repeat protein
MSPAHRTIPTLAAPLLCALALIATPVASHAQAAGPAGGVRDSTVEAPYGWAPLNRMLDRLKPSVDTRLPETPAQTSQRLEQQIDAGQVAAALAEIEDLRRREAAIQRPGTDVRLMFLHARALALSGDRARAMGIYRDMTVAFPELPEPWNNLAALYAAEGQLDLAREALNTALQTQPGYAAAHANLGDVYLMMAARAYGDAARLGLAPATTMQSNTEKLLANPSR